jgi:bacillithiol biosynthesis cysteine-adding enzyme BshC
MKPIPYDQLPDQPLIFLDAIRSFPKVARFFNGDFRDSESFRSVWEQLHPFPFLRKEVSELLLREQERFGAPKAACDNARLLSDANCAAVLTGQQIGILGGPLYTTIKAVAAIGWAKRLTEVLGIPVIPIFWMEGEDHDFEEVRRVNLLDRNGHLVSLQLEDRRSSSHQVVGWHIPGDEMQRFLDLLDDTLPPGLHHQQVMECARTCYRPGVSLTDGFGKWLSAWLGEQGLLVTESLNPELKKLAAPWFQKAVLRSDTHVELYQKRAQELEAAGYSCTLTPNPEFHFFYILKDGVRTAISRIESSQEQLSKLALEHPEVFSPKAILRPIIQDVLFPTVAIIAGPGEVSYLPQVQPFYQDFERPMPLIIPRPGVTLMEKAWSRNLEKVSLSVQDIFLPRETLGAKIVKRDDSGVTEQIDKKLHPIKQSLDELEAQFSDEPSLSNLTGKFRKDMEARLQQYKKRIHESIAAKNTDILEKIEALRIVIYPIGKLQERGLSSLNFLCRHGFQWVAERLAAVPIDEFDHAVIPMEE